MNFESLLNQLSECPGLDVLPVTNNPGGFRYVDQGLPEFVGPDVSPHGAIEQPEKPKVMIISAAGAVGKSTIAREIANKKQAPIWDLAEASAVGENSLTGQLTSSFGFNLAGKVSTHLKTGTLFLIIDALDEARVKANEAGFAAFIEDIAAIANNGDGTSLVLLGRTQTAETTWVLLTDLRVPTSLVSIQPFTREQAKRYIEARINSFDPLAAQRIKDHPQPFVEARDLVVDQLERAVGGDSGNNDEAAREFLGYAPVLETVAVLLAKESNYQEFIAGVKAMEKNVRQADRPLAILEHVVTRLLQREQKQKLQVNIKPALEAVAAQHHWNDWESLYSPDEQRIRLLGRILEKDFNASPTLPPAVRSRYEEQLAMWLPEHPFLREGREPANKVFESYLFAIAMREYLTPLSRLVENCIANPKYKPSRLLADFYVLLGDQSGQEVIAERQIGLLYDSLLAGETDSLRVRLSVESGDPEDTEAEEAEGEGEFELVYATSGAAAEQIEARNFAIVEARGLISFSRRLKETVIVTRGTVSLGGAVDDFEIGPTVDIRCDKLEIHSAGLVVRGAGAKPSPSNAVFIEANSCSSSVSRKPVVRGSLSVQWPGVEAYPWNEFAAKSADPEVDRGEMHEVHRRFRRIVGSLRSHSKGSLARLRDKVEHRRILQNDVGKALLQKLVDDGVMVPRDNFYHWDPERADSLLKVSWHDLRNRNVSPEMKTYFSEFIEEHRNLFSG